jgi:protein KRI1
VQPLPYTQEQELLKRSIVKDIHAAASGMDSDVEDVPSDDGFLVAKQVPPLPTAEPVLDVENADKDPETYLSNFMASRAWTQTGPRNLQPFESDDEEEERRAEEFEQAYNLRFEDPEKSNEKLKSHARDMAARYSVRRQEGNPRQKKREAEKAKKEIAKQQAREDKARLRKLRIEEMEEKVRRIKRAAGLHAKDLRPEDWSQFVDEDWDDQQWESEMQRRFGDDYYAQKEIVSDEDEQSSTKRKPRKPKFDDDIDIKDIIPDFEDEEARQFSLTDEEETVGPGTTLRKSSKKSRDDKKKQGRKERRAIEQLVDNQLQMDLESGLPASKSSKTGFRYRATSPQSFGLTAGDILMANDSNLNEFAGLKKLAAFRDMDKKRRDQKHLSKSGRLRKWRKEVFGDEDGPRLEKLTTEEEIPDLDSEDGGAEVAIASGRKKRRRKGQKVKTIASAQT